MKYRYDMFTAEDMGFKEHPQQVIRRFAPDAHNFEPVPVASCWVFEAAEIEDLPDFFRPLPSAK